jgi:hypothetical protein
MKRTKGHEEERTKDENSCQKKQGFARRSYEEFPDRCVVAPWREIFFV